MTGYRFVPPRPQPEGETWCKIMNEALLAMGKAELRFVPLATLPM